MPPTRCRGGNGLPRRSNSTGGFTGDWLADFAPGFGAAGLLGAGFFVFIGVLSLQTTLTVCRRAFAW
jgi:hypothetical protein